MQKYKWGPPARIFPNTNMTNQQNFYWPSESGNTREMMNALRDLSLKFDKHINETETKLQEYDQTVLTLSSQSNTRGGGSFYSNRRNQSYNFIRGRRGKFFSNSTGRNESRSEN